MSKITSEILAKVAPGTPKAKRDRFLTDFNAVLPRYGITTELRVSAFLTTVCFESDYFRATEEYASGQAYDITVNRKKAIGLGNTEPGDGVKYKGRTGIQTTGKKNYARLTKKIGIRDGVDFVANPKLLSLPKYFVEGACVYWDDNNLNSFADRGKFFAIQGLVNRGSATKQAKDFPKRLEIYQRVLSILPDNFTLNSAAASLNSANKTAGSEDGAAGAETVQNEGLSESPPSIQSLVEPAGTAPESIVAVQTPVVEVEMLTVEPETPKDAAKEDVLTRIGNKAIALWTALGTAILAVGNWLASTPVYLVAAVVAGCVLLGLGWMLINWRRNESKENRASNERIEALKLEAERKKAQEEQKFALQKLTLESAMRPDLHTVRLVPPPTMLPNSGDEVVDTEQV